MPAGQLRLRDVCLCHLAGIDFDAEHVRFRVQKPTAMIPDLMSANDP